MRVMIEPRALAPPYQQPGTEWSCIWSLCVCVCVRVCETREVLVLCQKVFYRADSSFLCFDWEKLVVDPPSFSSHHHPSR